MNIKDWGWRVVALASDDIVLWCACGGERGESFVRFSNWRGGEQEEVNWWIEVKRPFFRKGMTHS